MLQNIVNTAEHLTLERDRKHPLLLELVGLEDGYLADLLPTDLNILNLFFLLIENLVLNWAFH